jgi:aldehyde:ferredoxin oxidoreductase
LKTPHKSGPAKGVTVHLDKMLPEYYQMRGWDAAGVPTKEKLAELGLAAV